jgi:hypothetical protein
LGLILTGQSSIVGRWLASCAGVSLWGREQISLKVCKIEKVLTCYQLKKIATSLPIVAVLTHHHNSKSHDINYGQFEA